MTDPRIPEALTGGRRPAAPDPRHWCVYCTVSLLTWALGPAVLMGFAVVGLTAYGRAYRQGRRTSRCLLRDTRLVLLYLALILAAATVGTLRGW